MRSAMLRILAVSILALAPRAGGAQGVVIDHKKVDCIVVGRHARMNACFQPPSKVGKRKVFFRPEGVDKWFYVEMKSNAPCHEGVLPKAKKELLGKHVYYYVAAEGTDSAQTQEYDPVVVRGAEECKEKVVAPSLPNAPVVVFPSVPAGFVASAGISPLVVGGVAVAVAGGGAAFALTRDDEPPPPAGNPPTPQTLTVPPSTPTTPPSPAVPPPPPPTRNPLALACTATPRAGEAPLRVVFQAQPSGGTGVYEYLWRFGDGDTSTQAPPGHTYTAHGNYLATVQVTSGTDVATCERSITVTAPPPPPTPTGPFTLTVGLAGSGTGSVGSAPPGIACAPDCTEVYAAGTGVTLTATATGGSTFGGWTGAAGCGAGATCTVTMNANQAVTATFNPPATFPLNLTLAGTGTGTVGSAPPGIACPGDCTETYGSGTVVTLTATPTGTSTFGGWTGAAGCGAAATCAVTMNAAQNVTATFNPPATFPLNVTLAGTGTGTVGSAPPGIACPGDCTETYGSGTVVTLTATPTGTSTFGGWTGAAGCGANVTCAVTMNAAQNVTATFNPPSTFPLNVTIAGTGTGTVGSNPPGITCPGDCTESYASGTPVTLTATATGASSFGGWTGAAGCGAATTCLVTMTAAQNVTATFNPPNPTLTVVLTGTGSGGVTSNPLGIDCPGDCSEPYPSGTPVTLTARPNGGSFFVGWSGAAGCTTAVTCLVTLTASQTVTAQFNDLPTLTVNATQLAGAPGDGFIRLDPPLRDCPNAPSTCIQDYLPGTAVRLVPIITGINGVTWSGACTGTPQNGICSLTLTANTVANAEFFNFGFTVRGDQPTGLRWTSTLLARGAVGQVYLNGGNVGAVREGGAALQGNPRADNHVEAVVTEPGAAGTWRFEFPEGPGLEPGSLTPLLGEVVQVTGRSIVFRVGGRPGERVSFRFRVK